MSSISVGIITVGLSTISDRSENDRLRGTHYLDRPMSKWKYCMRMSAHFFPLSWPERCFFFFLTKPTFYFFDSLLPQIECVCTWTGGKCRVTRGRQQTYISILISFSGTFTDRLLVLLLSRVCYGSLGLARCLLTTLAVLMVLCGKRSFF